MDVEEYVQQRLTTLGKKHGFDPEGTARQVQGKSSECLRDYGAFQELVALSRKLELDVEVSTDFGAVKAEREVWTYVSQLVGTDIWKIGSSVKPPQRTREVQVGNHQDLVLTYVLPGGRPLEQALLRYFRKFKTRNAHRSGSEWRQVAPAVMKRTIARIKKEGPDFLGTPLPRERRA